MLFRSKHILAYADSAYIVKLLFSFSTPKHLYMVMEYLPGGDCFTLLSRGQAKHFHSMLRCVDHNRVARHALDSAFVKQWERRYIAALGELKSQIKEEEERATDIVGRGGRRKSKGKKDKRKRRQARPRACV